MAISIRLRQFGDPMLEFGGAGEFADPREGLRQGGPFDLRFGAARSNQINIGLVGPAEMVDKTAAWLQRCNGTLPADGGKTKYPAFPGFESVFRAALALDSRWTVSFGESPNDIDRALEERHAPTRFSRVLDLYADGVRRLSRIEGTKPNVIMCCLPPTVVDTCWSVENVPTKEERAAARVLQKRREKGEPDLFDGIAIEEQAEDLLSRDFRRALKARAMRHGIPVQLATDDLVTDHDRNQSPSTRAWNSSVALYYKAGGIPWRMKNEGPETCFVGVTFHHLRTTQRHLVQSSIAQAFSSQGDGFALRGGNVEWSEEQGRNVHLTEPQAWALGNGILEEYRDRTGSDPLRVVLHKTSGYSAAEAAGFRAAFGSVPIMELINLMPTQFRLVRFGAYPPNRGTLCEVNDSVSYLFTTGFMPELGTYPGPHIPSPLHIRSDQPIDLERAAQDILGLARMNWNTASTTGGHPVTLLFARRVGGIMAEYGELDDDKPPTSFRYYM
jgi:hypothetical protein